MSSHEDFPQPDDDDDPVMPFDDDEDQAPPEEGNAVTRFSLLSKESSDAGDNHAKTSRALDISDDIDEADESKKRKREAPTKKRKRRKMVLDDDRTNLSPPFIRDMMEHHGAYVDDDEESSPEADNDNSGDAFSLVDDLIKDPKLLTRPTIGDMGQLHPELLKIWANNTLHLLGKPLPYASRNIDDIEEAREQQDTTDEEAEMKTGDTEGLTHDDDGFPLPDEDSEEESNDAPIPFDDEEDVPGANDNSFANDMEAMLGSKFTFRRLRITAYIMLCPFLPR